MNDNKFDLICIGGGSGGLALATKAAKYGKRVALIEHRDIGGTCVNRGCIPKKILTYAANLTGQCHNLPKGITYSTAFNWVEIRKDLDVRLGAIRQRLETRLQNDGVTVFKDYGILATNNKRSCVTLKHQALTLSADTIAMCNGGLPVLSQLIDNHLALSSGQLFTLEKLPKSAIILGGGYIACEFASILKNFGLDVTMIYRSVVLRSFDASVRDAIMSNLEAIGVKLIQSQMKQICSHDGFMEVTDHEDRVIAIAEKVFSTLGRSPDVDYATQVGIKLNHKGEVVVDKKLQTSVPGVYALGDVTDSEFHLAPTAVWQGRKLADWLYGKQHQELNIKNPSLTTPVALAVFCQPEGAGIGLTEEKARKLYPDSVKIHQASFKSLKQSYIGENTNSLIKLITCRIDDADTDKVVGIHLVHENASELIQCLAFAMSSNASIDIDTIVDAMPVHPTFSEEIIFLLRK